MPVVKSSLRGHSKGGRGRGDAAAKGKVFKRGRKTTQPEGGKRPRFKCTQGKTDG